MDIKYNADKDKKEIRLVLPAVNKGKFRWKRREDNTKFGNVFATGSIPFSDDSYIEWQVGYDSEVGDTKKNTILTNKTFVGANGKSKHPYELSEILYLMKECGIITREDVEKLYDLVSNEQFLFDEARSVETKDEGKVNEGGFDFHQQDIILPTYSYSDAPDGCSIEISIQKQQYASGVQPMLYLTIPISCFRNKDKLIGSTSNEIRDAVFTINESNRDFILNTFRLFGLCSERHKQDVLSILNLMAEESEKLSKK